MQLKWCTDFLLALWGQDYLQQIKHIKASAFFQIFDIYLFYIFYILYILLTFYTQM